MNSNLNYIKAVSAVRNSMSGTARSRNKELNERLWQLRIVGVEMNLSHFKLFQKLKKEGENNVATALEKQQIGFLDIAEGFTRFTEITPSYDGPDLVYLENVHRFVYEMVIGLRAVPVRALVDLDKEEGSNRWGENEKNERILTLDWHAVNPTLQALNKQIRRSLHLLSKKTVEKDREMIERFCEQTKISLFPIKQKNVFYSVLEKNFVTLIGDEQILKSSGILAGSVNQALGGVKSPSSIDEEYFGDRRLASAVDRSDVRYAFEAFGNII